MFLILSFAPRLPISLQWHSIIEIPRWFANPFEADLADVGISLQEFLKDLLCEEILQAKFKDAKHDI